MDITIVGAGIAGLACGIRLRHLGHRVTILEKNNRPGGRCDSFEEAGFRFNTGPTLLMLPQYLDQLFSDVGRRREDYLDILPLDPAYRITFTNGKVFDLSRDMRVLERQLAKFGPREIVGCYALMSEAGEAFRSSMPDFIDCRTDAPSEFADLRTLLYLLKARPWRSVYDAVSRHFESAEMRMAFSFQTLYLGISPLKCTAIYTILSYIDLVQGVFYPRGGMHRIAEVLAQLFEGMGGRIRYGAEVDHIDLTDGRVRGVRVSGGESLAADIVVSNVDLLSTYRRLLRAGDALRRTAERMEKLKKSCSGVVFLWGLNRTYPALHHHNLVLPMAYKKTLSEIFQRGKIPDEPAYYVCTPSKTDPSVCPPGCENLMVLVPVPNGDAGIDWEREMPAFRRRVILQLEKTLLPGFSHHVIYERICDPSWYTRSYALGDGALFGFAPTFFQSAMFRPQHRSTGVKGLYFVGASTHPGNGVPIVLISARLAVETICEDFGVPLRADRPEEPVPASA